MCKTSLSTLGRCQLQNADGALLSGVLAQPKRFALLSYLVVEGPYEAHARDDLLAMFWPELPAERARNSLTQAVAFLRRSVGNDAIASIGRVAVRVDEDLLSCDAVSLQRAWAAKDHATVATLYHGELLPGLFVSGAPAFERWLDDQRESLKSYAVASRRSLAEECARAGDLARACQWGHEWLQLAPHDEAAVRCVMEWHQRGGTPSAALRVFSKYERTVREEFEAEPISTLVQLRDSLRIDGNVATRSVEETDAAAIEHRMSPVADARPLVAEERVNSARERIGWRKFSVMVAAAIFLVSLMGVLPPLGEGLPVDRAPLQLAFDESVKLRSDVTGPRFVLSPTGDRMAFIGGSAPGQIYIRSLDDSVARPVPGTTNGRFMQFAPDGQSILFRVNGGIHSVSLLDSTRRVLLDRSNRFSMGDNGSILFEAPYGDSAPGLFRVDTIGASPVSVTRIDRARGELSHNFPHMLPGGKAALFVIGGDSGTELAAVRIHDGSVTRLGIRGTRPRFLSPNVVLFVRRGDKDEIHGVQFDPKTLVVRGLPVRLLDDVEIEAVGEPQLDVAQNGTLVYLRSQGDRQLVVHDPTARTSRIVGGPAGYASPRLSPNNKLALVEIHRGRKRNVGVVDLQTGAMQLLTHDGNSGSPSWSADGRTMLWQTGSPGSSTVLGQAVDGVGAPQVFFHGANRVEVARSTGKIVAFFDGRSTKAGRIGGHWSLLKQRGPDTWDTVLTRRGLKPAVSPDGLFVAYSTADSGARVIRLQETEAPFREFTVSGAGAADPVWSARRTVLYRYNDAIVEVQIDELRAPVVRRSRVVTRDRFWNVGGSSPHYDVFPDGRLLVVEAPNTTVQPQIVLGWGNTLDSRLRRLAVR